jgi:phenylacetate-CoA ligase
MSGAAFRGEDRRLWNASVELMSRDEMRALQLERLRRQVAYNHDRSPFYRAKFGEAAITPDDVRSFEDFARLPLMTKDELRLAQEESLERYGDPYALLACARRDEIVRINATSGTTGTPTLWTLTWHDVEVVNEMHARKYWRAGVRPGDVIIQAVSLSMFTGGLPLSQGIQHLGAACIPVGIEGGTRRVLQFAELTKPTAIVATPSFGQYLIEECPKITGRPARELGLEWFFCAGEPGGGDPEVRRALADGFGAKVFDHTGGGHAFHGISCDEPPEQYSGMQFVSEDHCLLELVDPATKAAIEVADGATGEMVWTFLDWQGGPLMRFAVGDIASIATGPGPDGLPGIRFKIVGRADDMLIVKGVNVYPQAIQSLLFRFRPQVSGAFRVLLDRPGAKVTPPLRLRIERGKTLRDDEIAGLEASLKVAFREELRIAPAFEWVAPEAIPREAHKTRLVEIVGRAGP